MKGVYTITKYNAEQIDGEWVSVGNPVDVIEEDNIITPELAHQNWYIDYGQGHGITRPIACVSEAVFVGAQALEGNEVAGALYSIRGTKQNDAFFTASSGAVDSFWTFDTLINPPAVTTRQIRTVYMSNSYGGAADDVYSIVALSTPCPQTSTEILQITYKMTLDATTISSEGTRSAFASEAFFARTFGATASAGWAPFYSYICSYDRDRVWGKGVKYPSMGFNPNTQSVTEIIGGLSVRDETDSETLAKHRIHKSTTTGQFGNGNISSAESMFCGFPIKGVMFGEVKSSVWGSHSMANVPKGTVSSVQNTFGRIADTGAADRPQFLETALIATSAAGLSLVDKGDWVEAIDDSYVMPYLYKITMETGGLTGAGTYKIKRRKMARWHDNNVRWYPSGLQLPMMNAVNSGAQGDHYDKTTATTVRHGQVIWYTSIGDSSSAYLLFNSPLNGWAGYTPVRYNYPEFITFDYTGITINSANCEWTNVDTNTTPALSVTEVLQIATDGSDIYVADAATGLHKIERDFGDFDPTNYTITQLSPPGITDATSCRGVFAKGGSINGHPGKVVAIRIVRGGSNYAVADTVTFSGVNGTSAAAEVGTVDADGAITSIHVTNKGSGYIEDYLQTYVSSTTGGVGAKLEPIIGSGGDVWALFDDTTDAVMYLAHTTRITAVSVTNINFDTTADTIVRTGGDFIAEGFQDGMKIIIRNAEDSGNNGTFTITTVDSATQLTITENLTTNALDTSAIIEGVKWEVMRETITGDQTSVEFSVNAGQDTIDSRVGGTSFIDQGFVEGMEIVVSAANTGANNGIYTIASVAASTITLIESDTLTDDAVADSNAVISTLTDFTITTYTSGSPGRTGFIGLTMDTEHADVRFAMMTPTTKTVNDGSTPIGTGYGGWDWWSFANSTGTVAAGASDEARIAAHTDNQATAVEQFGPGAIGPLSTGPDHWVTSGKSDIDHGYTTWGSAATVVSRTKGQARHYNPLRNLSFNTTIPCVGTVSNQEFRTCDTVAQMNTASTSDTILLYDFGAEDTGDFTPGNIFRTGYSFGYIGKGLFWGLTQTTSTLLPTGMYVFSCNGDGTEATEEALPYGFWEEYGWDGNDWVLGDAGTKTTHAQVSFTGTGITITAATGAIVGAGFTSWAADGFLVGDIITIATSEDGLNNGQYVIESLATTTLTVTPNKLPAVNTTAAPDESATVVGDHALIDGLAISFDDHAAADALVVGETYDFHVFDGIFKDNATNFTLDTYWTWAADDAGIDDFSAAGTPATTIPVANLGDVTNVPLAALYYEGGSSTVFNGYVEPSVAGSISISIAQGIAFAHEIVQSTDFVLRFKAAGCYAGHEIHMGLVPWNTITDGSRSISTTELDENIKIEYDAVTYPEIEQYTVRVRDTGNGADQLVYSADRVQVITGQTQVDYDGVTGGYGDFIDGAGYANNDIITMNDGSTVTVQQSGGQVSTFVVNTPSLTSSGRTERIIGSNNYTNITFATGPDTMTQSGGTNFDTDGFLVGMKVIVDNSGGVNDGVFTITAVAGAVITVAETLGAETVNPAYFGTGLYQTLANPPGGTGFALTLGTHNETAVTGLQGGKDEFSMHRIGTSAGNVTWRLNGVVFYTYAGALHTGTNMGVCLHPDNTGWTNIYDASIDYNVDKRIMRVGNGTTTGSDDPNFRCLPSLLGGSDGLKLYYDKLAGAGPIEFVYVTDGYTAPAANEVSIIPFSGNLWFNTANDGDTITGNWTITKRDNLT